jgi:tetratricopeptide (TPR) repeat protein
LSNPEPAQWTATLRSQVEAALRYDPHDPTAWRAAGDLAWRFVDWDTAARWYRQSLAWKPDGLEHIAERLLSLPDGAMRLAAVLPPHPDAWRRLARYQFVQWRFASARESFAKAMQLANRRAVVPPAGEAVYDGSFTAAPELLLSPWMIESARGVEIKRRRADHDPPRLEATFRLGPGNWYHVAQHVMVEPGRRYRLTARVRVDGFEPEETFGVEVVHPYHLGLFAANAKCYADLPLAARLREPWPVCAKEFTTVEQTFTAPDDVLMLDLRLRRFDGDEARGGKVEFTDVSLQPLPDAPPEVADAR